MPTSQQLRAEIDAGPLAAELVPLLAVGDHAGVAAALSRVAYPCRRPVPIEVLAAFCAAAGVTGGVMTFVAVPLGTEFAPGVVMTPEIKTGLNTVMTVIQNDYRLTTADLDEPGTATVFDLLQMLGVVSAASRAAMLALADSTQSRASAAWGDRAAVTADAVSFALGGN